MGPCAESARAVVPALDVGAGSPLRASGVRRALASDDVDVTSGSGDDPGASTRRNGDVGREIDRRRSADVVVARRGVSGSAAPVGDGRSARVTSRAA
jgi:hypothetical protein